MAVPPSDARPPRSFRSGVLIGVLSALVAGLSTVVVILVMGNDGEGATNSVSPVPPPTVSPPPSASPKPNPPPGQVTELFREDRWVKGERLWLQVVDFDLHVEGCSVHAYKVEGGTGGGLASATARTSTSHASRRVLASTHLTQPPSATEVGASTGTRPIPSSSKPSCGFMTATATGGWNAAPANTAGRCRMTPRTAGRDDDPEEEPTGAWRESLPQ